MPDPTSEAKEESSPAKELGLGMSHEEGVKIFSRLTRQRPPGEPHCQ